MAPSDPSRSIMTTRSRTVQPRLKERAEQFLANADASQTFSRQNPEASRSRKRKLQDVDGSEKPPVSGLNVSQKGTSRGMLSNAKPIKKSTAMKSLDGEGEKQPVSSDSLGAWQVGRKRLASVPESTTKSTKLKSPKESDEKRLKRYRKQAPQSFLQKLYRSQTQR